MAKKARQSSGIGSLGANTTITIGTMVAVLSGVIWLTYYAGGVVRDVDGLKAAMAVVQSTLNRIEYATRNKD